MLYLSTTVVGDSYRGRIGETRIKKTTIAVFIIYLLTVLWFTVYNRAFQFSTAQLELFWSYKAWFAGESSFGREILANIAMFIPFGFLMSAFFPAHLQKKSAVVILAAMLFSLTIETLQLFLMRGLFEWDDVVSNTIGTSVGILLFLLINRLSAEKSRKNITEAIFSAFILTCFVAIAHRHGTIEADSTSGAYCFQVDSLVRSDNVLVIDGFCFRYDHPSSDYTLFLQSNEGTRIELVKEKVARSDVNEYFSCDCDYSSSGFTARGEAEEGEYEILIKWRWSIAISTGVYVGSSVHYAQENEFKAPTIDAEFVKHGVLRVYRPDYHCWVYQYNGSLYWIVDQDFYFEDDGSTYIQYQMWTTQEERLPQKRIENGWMWDNIGGNFEDYEIPGDWGEYRIMKRGLPSAYSVTSIVTGYHKNGKWVWQEYFRPYYEFE